MREGEEDLKKKGRWMGPKRERTENSGS